MRLSVGVSTRLYNNIVKGRTCSGYNLIAQSRQYDTAVSLTKTSTKVLSLRQRHIHSNVGSSVLTTITCPSSSNKCTAPQTYKSIYECVTVHANIGGVCSDNPNPVGTGQNNVPFIYNDCKRVGYMSVEHGLDRPSNIVLRTDSVWTELHDEQVMDPLVYLDNCVHLDPVVEAQFENLLKCYSYGRELTQRLLGGVSTGSAGLQCPIIKQGRQCISIGSVANSDELVRVWMVRPTINYSSYTLKTDVRLRLALANDCSVKFKSLPNYSANHVTIRCPTDEPTQVVISGTMAHYYILSTGVDAEIAHVSIGGSVLRVHQIKDFTTSPRVSDICINMRILSALVEQPNNTMTVSTHNNHIQIKYHTNFSDGYGPSLSIGCNGGFQWSGSPKNISESLLSMFLLFNKNIGKGSFVDAISASNYMARYIYPSGVQKAR